MKQLLRVASIMAAALISVSWLGVRAGKAGAPDPVDNYACYKAKDLKNPSAIPMITGATTSDAVGTNTCDLVRLSTVCLPNAVNGKTVNYSGTAQCCFKAKCNKATPTMDSVGSGANAGGSFTGSVQLKDRISLVCMPCNYAPL